MYHMHCGAARVKTNAPHTGTGTASEPECQSTSSGWSPPGTSSEVVECDTALSSALRSSVIARSRRISYLLHDKASLHTNQVLRTLAELDSLSRARSTLVLRAHESIHPHHLIPVRVVLRP